MDSPARRGPVENKIPLRIGGTRAKYLECVILTGDFLGKRVLLPRIRLKARQGRLPFQWTRLQFPVKLCYSMSINKSQGQTLQTIGVCLIMPILDDQGQVARMEAQPCFSHGQLIVALSRVGHPNRVFISLHADEFASKSTRCPLLRTALLTPSDSGAHDSPISRQGQPTATLDYEHDEREDDERADCTIVASGAAESGTQFAVSQIINQLTCSMQAVDACVDTHFPNNSLLLQLLNSELSRLAGGEIVIRSGVFRLSVLSIAAYIDNEVVHWWNDNTEQGGDSGNVCSQGTQSTSPLEESSWSEELLFMQARECLGPPPVDSLSDQQPSDVDEIAQFLESEELAALIQQESSQDDLLEATVMQEDFEAEELSALIEGVETYNANIWQ